MVGGGEKGRGWSLSSPWAYNFHEWVVLDILANLVFIHNSNIHFTLISSILYIGHNYMTY